MPKQAKGVFPFEITATVYNFFIGIPNSSALGSWHKTIPNFRA
jgi:hypothetical protein